MIVFTIYDNPLDYPGKIVVRRWNGLKPDAEPTYVGESIDEAREVVPDGLMMQERKMQDDPAIKEVWL